MALLWLIHTYFSQVFKGALDSAMMQFQSPFFAGDPLQLQAEGAAESDLIKDSEDSWEVNVTLT